MFFVCMWRVTELRKKTSGVQKQDAWVEASHHDLRHELMRNENGLTYARKEIILCGIALKTTGVFEESQIKPELQKIVKNNRFV